MEHFSQMLFLARLRTHGDRQNLLKLYDQCWGTPLPLTPTPELTITPTMLQLGWASLPRAGLPTEQIHTGMSGQIVSMLTHHEVWLTGES